MIRATKRTLLRAIFLLLDEQLKHIECEKVKREGNWDCHRCDECMLGQYIKRVKAGERPKIENQVPRWKEWFNKQKGAGTTK